MPALKSDQRRQLENVIIQARDLAEGAARSALQKRAVDQAKPFAHFNDEDKRLRRALRARGKQAGDVGDAEKKQSIDQPTQELAYEYWHRMLFARFLAENHLLMHPDGVAVSLEECEELAASERAPNGYILAARYASRMLPQIFRVDDVLLEIEFAPEQRLALERLLASLPRETFVADDSLGWVYQFWQTNKKDEVNKSGAKIDGRTLPAVTQLFTEDYMVQFLLHNTIGAWWCARQRIAGPPGEAGVPKGKSPVAMEYLRWKDDGTPAAGAFDGWPRSLKEFTMLDPCCASGHFLVAGFRLLVPLRMHDEGLPTEEACDSVLRENLFGLELDPRCTQIAAFALALAAWTYPGPDGQPLGYRPLPPLNIACSGQGVVGSKGEWIKIGNGDKNFVAAMGFLYDEFKRAPTLGSLINPRTIAESVFFTGLDPLRGSLDRILRRAETQADPDRAAVGVAAQGIALAASLMSREFTLIATNVPYLTRGKQAECLRDYLAEEHPTAKADIATAFLERCLDYCKSGGTTALVTPLNWLFLGSYESLRERLLRQLTWNTVAKLGPGAFETISGEVVNVALLIHTVIEPEDGHELLGLDASESRTAREKASLLQSLPAIRFPQKGQLSNPDARIVFGSNSSEELLSAVAVSYWGLQTGDMPRFIQEFWEQSQRESGWEFIRTTVDSVIDHGGCHQCILFEDGKGTLVALAREYRDQGLRGIRPNQGHEAWKKRGVLVSLMRELPVSLYEGELYDGNTAAIIPFESSHLAAIWCYCKSPEFHSEVRRIDHKLNVTNATRLKVPFDLQHWQRVAAKEYPNGLPEPHSNDPTQWSFAGCPKGSTAPLQVAVARLLGYRWPEQQPDDLDPLSDADGIVPIPAVRGEPPAVERARDILRTAFGPEWSASVQHRLLTESGAGSGSSLDDWLRNSFFEQHFKLFHQRPFIWHLWDGRKDGFSCLVNYHKLTHKLLDNLTYSYVQDWINLQAADARSGKPGADLRLADAQALQDKLKLILAGEPPYDIFVRWKPLSQQPIGWNPHLNDGVRVNIRPFVQAGILRKNPSIKWTKDRDNEPQRPKEEYPWFWDGGTFKGDRVNDVHLTIQQKMNARKGRS